MFSMLEMPVDNLGTSEHFHGKQVCMYIWRSRIVGQYYATNKQGGHQRWSPVICSRRTCRNYEAVSGARSLLRHWHWELPLVNGRTSHTIFVLHVFMDDEGFTILFSVCCSSQKMAIFLIDVTLTEETGRQIFAVLGASHAIKSLASWDG